MENMNLKIAKELNKIARELVAGGEVANQQGQYRNFTGTIDWYGIKAQVKKATFTLEKHSINWKNGIWENGTWYGGLWENGIWENGTWDQGTWDQGTWENGTWKRGTWKGGLWWQGTWKNGTWKSGKDGSGNDYKVSPDKW